MLEQYIQNNVLRFFAILILSFIALRISIWILEKIILKLTIKTKTDLDDLILKKTKNPLTFLVFFIGLKISLAELVLSEGLSLIVSRIIFSFMFLIGFVIFFRIFMLIIDMSWRSYSKSKGSKNEAMYNLVEGFMKAILVISAFLVLLSYWGVQIGPLLAGLGIGGIAIAFALQSSLANIFGGISIILDKTVRVGDLVNLDGGVSGKILKISLRATKIKTFDNEIIIVPNSKLADSNIHNIAQPEPKSRAIVPFGVAYGADIEKVKKIVLTEIKKIKGFVKDPEPSVKFLEMGDSSLNFKAYFFVDSFENRFAAIDEANTRIYNALNKAKIEIPFPQMDVRLKK